MMARYLSVVTAIRWHTIDTEMKRDISSSARQTADCRIILHVINIGTATRPVSRSDVARLHSSKLVIERRYFFFAIKSKTKPLTVKIKTAKTIAGISAAGSKYWCISPLNPSSSPVSFGDGNPVELLSKIELFRNEEFLAIVVNSEDPSAKSSVSFDEFPASEKKSVGVVPDEKRNSVGRKKLMITTIGRCFGDIPLW